jgi:hypothetical protein
MIPQRWIIEFLVLRELTVVQEGCCYRSNLDETNEEGQLPQPVDGVSTMFSAFENLWTNSWRTRSGDDAHRVRGVHVAE